MAQVTQINQRKRTYPPLSRTITPLRGDVKRRCT
ncbi:hypothetical protein [Salmonella phage SD-13_S19]|nr:hypothetical protein [Salmonella phage SD-11_S17]WPK20277.1 hypothetical protein [Salmonella phage SD-12_S18]WPK20360.1 hypothetical protein [Salmonella phage SD-13_S19]WPK20450.1 hypothetical protein [Salmonella phage SD-14_S20]